MSLSPIRVAFRFLEKVARTKTFDLEKGDFGVTVGNAYGWMSFISIYSPLENIGRRGKTATKRECRIDDGRYDWADTFQDRVQRASNAKAAYDILDDLMEEARKSPSIMKDPRGNPSVTDYVSQIKGVDQSLPTPKAHILEDIEGKDITVILNSKPIEVYSESYAKELDEMHMVYWFRVHPRFKSRLVALADELKKADNLDAVAKILKREQIPYDQHTYMHPMYD